MANSKKSRKRSIFHLVQSAKEGNFASSYQLYKNYFEGKNVGVKDEELANHYLSKVESALIEKKMVLSSLTLTDFRRFSALDIEFDERITVLIGVNGAGKTSVADALSKTFSWLNNNLEKSDVVGRPVTDSDIKVDSKEFSEVATTFKFDKSNTFNVSIGNTVLGYEGGTPTHVVDIRQVAEMYKSTAKNSSIHIPLLVFYSVERSSFSWPLTTSEVASGDIATSRFSDLKSALDGSGKLEDFSKLYIEMVNRAKGEGTKEVQDLKVQIENLQATIDDVYADQVPPEGNVLSAKLKTKKEELVSLMKTESSRKYQRHLEQVNQAIESLVPEVRNLEVDRSSGKVKLMVENFGNRVNIAQLSQGQKMLVALSGDLARRLVNLNPDSDDPLLGHGIVVIDEVELHLHPKWQQEILIRLQNTFPNLQFIVTTHSPQVLSTVDKECIRILRFDSNGVAHIDKPKFQTKGVSSSDVLEQIMGTFSTPAVSEANWLSDYSALVAENLWTSEEGRRLFDEIIRHFGSNHPEVIKIKGEIRTQEFKLKAKALKGG
ncbi:DNA replication and repair protein RecF [Marinomonas gallaica]|uniref:DNA replication and repair protein RecF n=1 Tax=Marinomonas gallaica TaxID=1806667 RepID=A0A1C3JRN3_9GAMM|nr:retron Ec78 anti-phage system effector ATPase PtuA [Marinomonas gallaica]SBT17854.1 DNA replication and repair protein RecF [Marinomonas gallaica]SBT22060.1 DNA replication and repair protein RecF [Marinomonas gallaica]